MEITIGILLFCITIIVILLLILIKRQKTLTKLIFDKHKLEVLKKDELKEYFKEEWNLQEQKLNEELKHHEKELELRRRSIENEYANLEQKLKSDYTVSKTELEGLLNQLNVELRLKEKRYNEVNQDLEIYRSKQIEEIDKGAAEHKKNQELLIQNSLNTYRIYWTEAFNEELAKISQAREQKLNELKEITNELEEERTRRAAINEEILRRRQLEEQQDFYRIQLDEGDELDIKVLHNIIPRLKHPEAINKIIWSGYYQKPLAELRKRLLPNGDVSGIYKITRLRSGEIYIGQSTSIDKRFQEHVKSALGVGNLASSLLHKTMAADRPENFTFEILEETPKEKLKERESYYIDFYDSKTYGLNSIRGEQK